MWRGHYQGASHTSTQWRAFDVLTLRSCRVAHPLKIGLAGQAPNQLIAILSTIIKKTIERIK